MRLGHVALSVSNLSRSIVFYSKHLGLRCIKTYDYKDKKFKIALLKKGDICLELFEFKVHKPLPSYRRALGRDLQTLGVKHFSVEVPDIPGIYRKLKRAGVVFETDVRVFEGGAQYFFFKDPDGILIEVMEAT